MTLSEGEVGGGGYINTHENKGRVKWPLERGNICIWDTKEVATGRVRGVAVGEG